MKCELCGREFTEEEAIKACKGCPIHKCELIKCPNCGYEILPEPGLVKFLRRVLKNEGK